MAKILINDLLETDVTGNQSTQQPYGGHENQNPDRRYNKNLKDSGNQEVKKSLQTPLKRREEWFPLLKPRMTPMKFREDFFFGSNLMSKVGYLETLQPE